MLLRSNGRRGRGSSGCASRRATASRSRSIAESSRAYDEIKEPGRTPIQVDATRCRELAVHIRTELERIFTLSEKFTPGS